MPDAGSTVPGAPVRVLFVAPECYPLIKTGGLADVTGALPLASRPVGHRCAGCCCPAIRACAITSLGAREVARLPGLFGGDGTLVARHHPGRAPRLARRCAAPLSPDQGGGPYQGADGHDWPDNDLRFAALSWAAAELSLGRVGISRRPDVVHLHDWQAAPHCRLPPLPPPADPRRHLRLLPHLHHPPTPAPAYRRAVPGTTHLSVARDVAPAECLQWCSVRRPRVLGQRSASSRQGCSGATTSAPVSPTYAREIVTPDQGMGFDGLLAGTGRRTSPALSMGSTPRCGTRTPTATSPSRTRPSPPAVSRPRPPAKPPCRSSSASHVSVDTPLFCVVSRLAAQKGLDLLFGDLPRLFARGAQLAVLGAGDPELENGFRRAADLHPGQVAFTAGYDEALSHRLQAGADSIVVPSRFEPCGLTQLYGLRYGTLPVVARVGGLADTIIDANEAAAARRRRHRLPVRPGRGRRAGGSAGPGLRPLRRHPRLAGTAEEGDDPRRGLGRCGRSVRGPVRATD